MIVDWLTGLEGLKMTRTYTKSGNPRKPKKAQKPSTAATLAWLGVGEFALFPAESVQATMASIQSVLVRSPWLMGRTFVSERVFLVREGEVTSFAVRVKRVESC